MVLVDRIFYNKWILAPFAIISYNVLQRDAGSELFGNLIVFRANIKGTEPWWFYFANGVLDWNIAFPLAIMAPICVVMAMIR